MKNAKIKTLFSCLIAIMVISHSTIPFFTAFALDKDLETLNVRDTSLMPLTNKFVNTINQNDASIDSWMPDKNLQSTVSERLGISSDVLTQSDMLKLTSFDAARKDITSLKGLEYATNLSGDVDLNYNTIENNDYSPLFKTQINYLRLSTCNISDISQFNNMPSLRTLVVPGNHIRDISSLSNSSVTTLIANSQTIELNEMSIPEANPLINISGKVRRPGGEIVSNFTFNDNNSPSGTYDIDNDIISWLVTKSYQKQATAHWNDDEWIRLHYNALNIRASFNGTIIQPFHILPEEAGNVTVNYENLNGSIIAASETLKGNIGDPFTTKQKDIQNYTFKEVQGATSGNFTDQAQTVTYIYESSTAAPVTVKYEDKTGNEIAPSEELNGKIGDSYLAQAKNISGYVLKTTPANAGGRFTDKPQSVTFIYSIDQTKLTTHDSTLYIGDKHYATDNLDSVVDEDGNPVDFKKVKVIGGDLMEHQSMGGDHLDIVETGTFDIQYGYGGKSATAIVIVKDNKTSIEAIDSTIYVGDTWNAKDNFTSASDKEGNSVDFKKITTSGSVDTTKTGSYDITYTNDNVSKTITVNVVENNSITVHYQDEKGNQISPDKVLKGKAGDSYSSDELKISGYTFKEVKGDASGKFTNNAQTVTYIYTKDLVKGAEVTVHYQDENGSEIAPDKILNGNLGSPYISEQLKIDGYTFKKVQGETSGNFTDKEQIVTYIYRKNPVKGTDVNVHYQDEQGNKLASDDRLSGNIGDGYTSIKKEIAGYTFKKVQGNVTGTFTDKTQTVIYIYSKDKVASVVNPPKSSEGDKDKEIISEKSNGKGTTEKTQSVDSVSEKQLPETGETQLSVIATMLTGLVILSFSILMGRKQIKK